MEKKSENTMEKISKLSTKYPWLILSIILIISVFFTVEMMTKSRLETDLDEYMPQKNPAFMYSDSAEAIFNIKDGILIAIENKSGVYNTKTLQKVKDLTKALKDMTEIERDDVNSLYEAENIVGVDGGMEVTPFYDEVPTSPEELKELRNNVRSNVIVYGRIVSNDETVTILTAEIKDNVFSIDFYNRLLDVAKGFEDEENTIYIAGKPIIEGTLVFLAPKDMQRMVPIVVLVIIIVLFLALRSIKATLLTFLGVILSIIWSFGLMAAVGVPIYSVATILPVMLIAMGVAYAVYLFNHIKIFLLRNPEATQAEALNNMVRVMGRPVIISAITTAVGFMSLLTSEVYPIKYFGLFTAFGILVALTLSLLMLPSALMLLGIPKNMFPKKGAKEKNHPLAVALTTWVLSHKKGVIIGAVLVLLLSGWGIQKVWINSSFIDKFNKDSDIVLTDHIINEKFGGTTILNVVLNSPDIDAFKQPDILKLADKMQVEVDSALVEVGNTFSLTHFLKVMNKVLHDDNPEYYRIPESQDLNAQYLLLYEMSGDPDNLWKQVDYDYSKANLTFQLKGDDTKTIKAALDRIDSYKDDFKKLGVTVRYAGSGYKAMVFTQLILDGQIQSLAISLLIIIVIMSITYGEISVGLIASVPILITTVISFAVMGFLNVPLSTTTALLASIAMGVGIDYAVQFNERYRDYRQIYDDKTQAAIATMNHTGRAIMFNAIIVISGFLVMLFSVFPPNRELGALISLNMFTSFVGTVTIMLVLVHMKKKFKINKS
jgi:hypothetical protein